MKSIGEIIVIARKEKGLTQNQLAEKMNVTDKAVSKWERDLSCPDINSISKLAEILDLSVEELLSKSQQETKNTKINDMINLIFKAVALAMGIGVTVLNILNQIDSKSSFIMLGIGVACLGVYLLDNKKDE